MSLISLQTIKAAEYLVIKDKVESCKAILKDKYKYSNLTDEERNYIYELNSKIDVFNLLTHLGLKGERIGDFSSFQCSFENDKGNHSIIVWDKVPGAHDYFEDCTYDIIDLIIKIKGWDFITVLKFLSEYARLDISFPFSVADDTKRKKNQPSQLIDIALGHGITHFHDQYDEAFVLIKISDNNLLLPIQSNDFKSFISNIYWEKTHMAANSESLRAAINILEAKAKYESVRHKLSPRVARLNNAIWYNLGDGAAVKITKEDWQIIENPPILFRPYKHQKVQIRPERASIDLTSEIFKFVRILDGDQRTLFIAKLTTDLVPDIPHPIDVIHGPQGSCKSTIQKLKKDLIDPSRIPITSLYGSKNDFVQTLHKHHNIVLDNQSYISSEQSDQLCRAVTGEGISKRKLYTDDDEIIFNIKNCISINGINVIASKPDLLQRCLIFSTSIIPPEERMNEYELWVEFEKVKPKLLGAYFSLLSKAMCEYENVKLDWKPRMADFAHWGSAVSKALGFDEKFFIKIYRENMQVQNEEALEASPIAQTIVKLMENRERYEDSPSNLLSELDNIASILRLDNKDRRYPRSPKTLWKRIKEIETNLLEVGITIERYKNLEGRKIVILKES